MTEKRTEKNGKERKRTEKNKVLCNNSFLPLPLLIVNCDYSAHFLRQTAATGGQTGITVKIKVQITMNH